MKAVILAAGRGSRFKPFSVVRPKPLFKVLSRPIIEWVIKLLLKANLNDIIIVEGFLGDVLETKLYDFINKLGNVSVTFISQEELLGTAVAVKKVFEEYSEDLVVVPGDLLIENVDPVKKLVSVLESEKAAVPYVKLSRYDDFPSVIVENNYIKEVCYKPRPWEFKANGAVIGIYGFRYEVADYVAKTPPLISKIPVGIAPPHEADLFETVRILIDNDIRVRAFELGCEWYDVDYPWDPLHASHMLARWEAKKLKEGEIYETASIEEGVEIKGKVSIGRNSIIRKGSVIIGPVWIGENVEIKEYTYIVGPVSIGNNACLGPFAKVSASFLGDDVCIGHAADLDNAVVMDGSYVFHWSHVSGVLGERCDIGAGTVCGTLRFDDEEVKVLVNQKFKTTGMRAFGVLMGDYSRTGVGVLIYPGRKIGPYSVVGPGVVVKENIEPFTAVLLKEQKLEKRKWGPEIYENTSGWLK